MDERPEEPAAALAGRRAGGVSCRLLGPPRLARSVRGENLDRAAGGLFRALEKGERLYTGVRARRKGMAIRQASGSSDGNAGCFEDHGEWRPRHRDLQSLSKCRGSLRHSRRPAWFFLT